jgi:hypothetical protein
VRAAKYGPPTFTGGCSSNAAFVLTNEGGERDLMTGVLFRLLIYRAENSGSVGFGAGFPHQTLNFYTVSQIHYN